MMPTLAALRSQLDAAITFRRTLDAAQLARTAIELPARYLLTDGEAGEPLAVNLLITLRCNLRCTMCDYQTVLTKQRRGELSSAEIGELARSFKGKPCFFFSGGEPFVRSDLLDCMRAVKAAGLKVGVITNGLLIDAARIDELVELDIETIIFSLHGDAQRHDAVVGQPGAHAKLLETVRAFCTRRRNTQVLINCAINEQNIDHLDDVVRQGLAAGADQVRMEHLVHLTPRELHAHSADIDEHHHGFESSSLHVNTYVHDLADPGALRDKVLDRMAQLDARYPGQVLFKPHMNPTEVERWYQPDGGLKDRRCYFVWTSAFIDPSGNVIPCQFYPRMKFGNVREQPFAAIYNGADFRRLRRELRQGLFGGCRRCCKL